MRMQQVSTYMSEISKQT